MNENKRELAQAQAQAQDDSQSFLIEIEEVLKLSVFEDDTTDELDKRVLDTSLIETSDKSISL